MYRNLIAEMARQGITNACMAKALNMTPSTFSLKINGKSEFSMNQAARIKSVLKVEIPLEVLFATAEQAV